MNTVDIHRPPSLPQAGQCYRLWHESSEQFDSAPMTGVRPQDADLAGTAGVPGARLPPLPLQVHARSSRVKLAGGVQPTERCMICELRQLMMVSCFTPVHGSPARGNRHLALKLDAEKAEAKWVMHLGKSSTLKFLWPAGFLLIFGVILALVISTGAVPRGAPPHQVAAGPTSASDTFSYLSKNLQGIELYSVISAENGYGPQTLRVLTPAHPASGVSHNFLIVLPVEAGLGDAFGDGLAALQALDVQDKYNLTIIEPTFAIDPWYANNPKDPHLQYETFMTTELAPWIKQNLATTGHEHVWLIGFSKSGLGAQDLILKHPGVFALAASWDSPFDASSYDQFGEDSAANYGTDASFQANYRLTKAFVHAHRAPFLSSNRIWIGGFGAFEADDAHYDALLNSEGIAHSTETPQYMVHRWDSGWVAIALAALYEDSLNMQGS